MPCIYIPVYIYTYIYMYIYTHTMEYYSAIEKKNILPFATTWMETECVMLSEISQAEKDKYDFTHVEFKKHNTGRLGGAVG